MLRSLPFIALSLALAACAGTTDGNPEPDPQPDAQPDPQPDMQPDPQPDMQPDPQPDVNLCAYPAAPAVMTLNQPLPPYSWPNALDAARTPYSLDMEEVYCNTDDDIDWSPFDVLLFIGIPAW